MRAVLGAVVLAAAVVPVTMAAAPADAAASCTISRTEYRHVHRDMTRDRVAHIVGCSGRVLSAATIGGDRYVTVKYRTGNLGGAALIDFANGRVESKLVVW